MKFYVLLADIMGSSRHRDRAALTDSMQSAVEHINERHQADLFAPLEITRGDEMAAVFTSIHGLYSALSELERNLHPVRFRSVVVYDELTAGLDSGRAGVMDGPAFYRARERMTLLKRSRTTFALSSGQKDLNEPAEVLVNLLQWRWSEMTKLQREIVRLYQVERNQLKVAEALGRSQQQISHSLIATKWELIDQSEVAIRHLLELVDRNNGTIGGAMEGKRVSA
ncbi:MAG: SatD family protein [Acidobacteriota bacterium]